MKDIKIPKTFIRDFSHLYNESGLTQFYIFCKDKKLKPREEFKILIKWNDIFNLFNYNTKVSVLKRLINRKIKRTNMLKSKNMRTDTIDYSLFVVFNGDNEETKTAYKNFCDNKTKKMRKVMNDNPILRKNDLTSLIIRYGEEEGTTRYNTFVETQKKGSKRCIEYWLSRGYSEEKSKLEVAKHQCKFSLDTCIEKYGEEEGICVWEERQKKWQETPNNKPQHEIEEINKKKSTKINYDLLWNTDVNVDGKFYILELDKNVYKIGISQNEIHKRYNLKTVDKVIYLFDSTLNHVFHIEQILKLKYFKNMIKKHEQIGQFGWTETFKNIDIDCLLKDVKQLENITFAEETFNILKVKIKEKILWKFTIDV